MDIRYANINELLEGDDEAVEFYNTLPEKVQKSVLENGNGINNYEELVHFVSIIEKRGCSSDGKGCCCKKTD